MISSDADMIAYDDELERRIARIARENPKNYTGILKARRNEDLARYIRACTPMLDDAVHTFKTRVYWTLNRLREFPACGNDSRGVHRLAVDNVSSLAKGYPKYCGPKCQHEAPSYFEAVRKGVAAKYGVENPFQIDAVRAALKARAAEIQEKRDATRRRRFGDAPGWNLAKSLETRLARYGCAWNQSAVRKTKAEFRGDPGWNNPEKNFETRRRNGTLNSSRAEDASYELLAGRFGAPDVVRQYRSEQYPFACDFYVRSRRMYVECNYGWTHGGHWFDPSDPADAERVRKWKEKGTGYYKNAVDTWTRRDPAKRAAAGRSGIDYRVFWDFEDFRVWLELSTF